MHRTADKVYIPPEQLLERLSGARLVMAGCDGSRKQEFARNLAHMAKQNGVGLTVEEMAMSAGNKTVMSDGTAVPTDSRAELPEAADYVMLFWNAEGSPGADDAYAQFFTLTEQMELLSGTKVKSVLLVSDYSVYGKCFGGTEKKSELQLGYVSHTSAQEIPLHCMRMAEHFACRLARESGLRMKVVRAAEGLSGEAQKAMILAAVKVMLDGVDGEIYNLPGSAGDNPGIQGMADNNPGIQGMADNDLSRQETRSPLAPIHILPDTEKVSALDRSDFRGQE